MRSLYPMLMMLWACDFSGHSLPGTQKRSIAGYFDGSRHYEI
eukprot:gene733-2516_t